MSQPERIRDLAELDPLIEASRDQPLFIFKHSLTCSISAAAFREYQRFVAGRQGKTAARFALVEIQSSRPVSSGVAERTGVRHESPQAILLKDGRAVWHASHWSITERALEEALAAGG